jgi:hypothetical protein
MHDEEIATKKEEKNEMLRAELEKLRSELREMLQLVVLHSATSKEFKNDSIVKEWTK